MKSFIFSELRSGRGNVMHKHLPIIDFHQHLTCKKPELMNALLFSVCPVFHSIWVPYTVGISVRVQGKKQKPLKVY